MKNKISRKSFYLIFWFFLAGYAHAFAQSIRFNALSINDGLSQASATCFTQDRAGFIWVGTRDGLNRYDGYSFSTLQYDLTDSASISNNSITDLVSDRNGNVWAGTNFGLNRIDGNTLRTETFYHWFEDSASVSSNHIRALAQDKLGRIWVGTDNGLNRLDDIAANRFIRYSIAPDDAQSLSNNTINDILVDSQGRIWIATNGGLNKYIPETNSFKRFRRDFDDNNSISDNRVLALCEDHDGIIWIGTRSGLNRYNPEMGVFTRYFMNSPRENLLSSNIINALQVDRKGDLWIGTPTGLTRFAKNIEHSTQYHSGSNRVNGLRNDFILSLLMDRSGMIWVGTQSAGIATLDLEAPQFFSHIISGRREYEAGQNQIFSFFQMDSDRVWTGTGAGLAVFSIREDTTRFYSDLRSKPSVGKINHPVLALNYTSDSTLWLGTNGAGLYSLDLRNDSLKNYRVFSDNSDGLSSNRISDMYVDVDENLWIATLGGGVCYFDRNKGVFETYKFKSSVTTVIRDNNIQCILGDTEHNIWFGTGNAGLYRLDRFTGELSNFTAGNVEQGFLPSNSINDLYCDSKGRIWVATSGGGIAVYRKNKNHFTTYNTSDGLVNNVALAITADDSDNLWVSTNGGISAFDLYTETFRNYNEQDILGQNTFNTGSCLACSNGIVFFGGSNGFDYFNSNGLKENKFIPPVVITGYQVINRADRGQQFLPRNLNNSELELEYNHSGFSLEFAALNYKQSGKNQYAYRLKGLFDTWRYIGTRNFATFSNLNPGKYTFEVIGSNNDGYWSESPARLTILVHPAIWQTMWFQVLGALAVAGCLYLFYKYKLASARARNRILELAVLDRTREISKERDTNAVLLKEVHHRVKNNLQIIVSLLNLQSRFIRDSKLLDVFGEIQNRVRSMSMIHEKMYKTKDLQTVNIEEYITDLSENLIHTYRVGHQIELDVDIEVNSFKSDTLTPLGLIINEVISNALKYAFREDRTGKIFVHIVKIENGNFRMIIGDNGIGMPADLAIGHTESFGTELISALSEQLEGTIRLLPDRDGTVYEVIFRDVEN